LRPADIAKKTLFTSSSVFDIASVTKTFTGAAIALLHQRGELNVSLPVGVYLPRLANSSKNRLVTLQDLLWHTSGLPDYLEHFTEDRYPNLVNSDVIEFTRNHLSSSQPGLEFKYCNTSYALLASIIEAVSGQNYAEFLEKEIFQPLGLNNTYVAKPNKLIDNHVSGYEKMDDDVFIKSQLDIYVLGDGGVFSTALDLVKWVQSYLKQHQLLKKEIAELIFSNGQTDKGQLTRCGWGVGITNDENHKRFGHIGGWTGVATFIGYDVSLDATVVVLSNQGEAPVYPIAQAYFNLFIESN
jgi:CubicO group peptidase (beta-lactamase class C family)